MTDSTRPRTDSTTLSFAERYVPVALLGAGSYAEVFRAEDRASGGAVALKILHDRVADSAVWPARERFEREIAVMRTLGHPAVVPVLDHGYRPDPMLPALERPAIVLPLVDGETLAAVIERRERWPLSRVVPFLETAMDVLLHLQAHGIVHRDLGPQNVFVTPAGGFLVADFGMARPLDSAVVTRLSGTLTEALAARVLYVDAANRGGVLTSASDVISVARIAIALARGRHYAGPPRVGDAGLRDWPADFVGLLAAASADGASVGPEEFLRRMHAALREPPPTMPAPRAPLVPARERRIEETVEAEPLEHLPMLSHDSSAMMHAGGIGLTFLGVLALLQSGSGLSWLGIASQVAAIGLLVLGAIAAARAATGKGRWVTALVLLLLAIVLAAPVALGRFPGAH